MAANKPSYDQRTIVTLNSQQYVFELRLVNTQASLLIPPGIVDEFLITDSIYSIFPTGRLIIDNTGNSIDNFVNSEYNELKERVNTTTYAFNTDSRDQIYVNIKPISEGDDSDFPPEIWGMEYTFAIYDEEDIIESTGIVKQKVFYLRDVREQALLETNLSWSTASAVREIIGGAVNLAQVNNEFRKAKTGIALKSLIKNILPNATFDSKWDEGATRVFYTSTPQSNGFDDLEYLLDRHVSNTRNDNSILTVERNNDFSLHSLNHIFSKATNGDNIGPYVVDVVNLDASGLAEGPPAGASGDMYGLDAKSLNEFPGLTNFSFLNVANLDSLNELITTFVHSYDTGRKQFSIDGNETHISSIKNKLQQLYADEMLGKNPSAILPINEGKLRNKLTNSIYSGGATTLNRLRSGMNKVLQKALAFAPSLSYDVEGSTTRRSCRFSIALATNADQASAFVRVVTGQWLITKVHHVFVLNSNGYENTVTCIKPYASNNIINQEVKVQHGKIVQDMKTSGQVFDDDRGELITLPPRGQPQ